MKANEIITVLNHFKDSSYQTVLIDGTWGIGKTEYVSKFKDTHSEACYVSLFGKKDIESIIQEIYFQVVESVPNGKLKKYFRIGREIFNNFNFEFQGVSISVPLIGKLHSTMYKELGKKGTYIIIFDDLERKHHDLDIKEILGLIDSLAKIENIKTVLIAATDQLNEEDEKTFIEYKEKAIDRTYTIDGYADDAPVEILGEQTWNVIGKLVENFSFYNLRTFEKTNLFIKEVLQILGENIFTDKFTRDDIYRMCFATVFFNIEHKSKMVLLETEDVKTDYKNSRYTSGESGVIEYMYDNILKNSLDNVMSKNIFQHIKNWYETGTFSKEDIIDMIASINSYEEKPKSFYSSEQEILELIDQCREYIRNLHGTEPMEDIISRLSNGFAWCEALSIDFGISNEEIVLLVTNNISNSVDLGKRIHQNEIDLWHFHIESEEAKRVIVMINETLRVEYYSQLIKRITECFNTQSYEEYSYLRELNDSIISITDTSIRDNILRNLKDNKFLFPIPTGRITEDQWYWCHRIKLLIKDIDQHWDIENYYNEFIDYINSLEIVENDKLLQHRLKTLLNR